MYQSEAKSFPCAMSTYGIPAKPLGRGIRTGAGTGHFCQLNGGGWKKGAERKPIDELEDGKWNKYGKRAAESRGVRWG